MIDCEVLFGAKCSLTLDVELPCILPAETVRVPSH